MDVDLERYSCQMALPGFGKEKQQLLQKAKVLIIGMGGLGCPAAQYLTAAGIGTIGIADDDLVSLNNLHRQFLYTALDVGAYKVSVAAEKLRQQNPSVHIVTHPFRVTSSNILPLISAYDLIIDGTDNLETKLLINDAGVITGKAVVYGAIYQYEGQVSVWNVRQLNGSYSPNYRDVFPDADEVPIPNCAEGGVIPTLAGIVGCMQANEAIKYWTDPQDLLAGKLWLMNVKDATTRVIKLKNTGVRIEQLPETVKTVTVEQLKNSFKEIELIDVRSRQEHQAFSIGGKNIPLHELESHLDAINISIPIVCYCSTGVRSAAGAKIIRRHFLTTIVHSLKNGIEGLQSDILKQIPSAD